MKHLKQHAGKRRPAGIEPAGKILHRAGAMLGAFVLMLASGSTLAGQQVVECPAPAGMVGDLEQPDAAVRYLSDDALRGRLAGTPGERCTAEYVAVEFARIGLSPGGIDGTYLQPVTLRSAINAHAPAGQGMNVVGILEGSDPELRSEAVVIGAHHDHLGEGRVFGSVLGAEETNDLIHNGADDNASGVGVLIRLAEIFAEDPPARSIVFTTFTGEEFGLLGSAHYAQNPSVPLDRTVAMLNMDMVGRLGEDPLIVNGTGTAEEWDSILDRIEGETGVPFARSTDGFGPSDHTSFYAHDVPVLHFFTNVHGEYHHPDDEWGSVDLEGMDRVGEVVERVTRAVADRPEAISPVQGAGTPPSEQPSGYGAYLGTVPDFAPVDFGVRLSGVSGGSPAEEAGMRSGDILVRLGDLQIEDLYALTEALQTLQPGTEVEATVLRDGEELTVPVTLRERP